MYHDAIYTVGHSNRELEDFIGLLREAGITRLMDVRRHPYSRRYPRFSREPLCDALSEAQVAYEWAGRALGGRRPTHAHSPHRALGDEGMRGYADHMGSAVFRRAVEALIARSPVERLALMCAERDPGHCHRSLIADSLAVRDVRVVHLIGPGEAYVHTLNPAARPEAGAVVYDRNTNGELDL